MDVRKSLTLRDLSVEIRRGDRVVRPIANVSLELERGETLGIVGETGSGKSMTGLAIMGMLPAGGRVTGGSIDFAGRDLLAMEPRRYRGNEIAMIFQDSLTSLNPTKKIVEQVAEPVRLHRNETRRAARDRALEMLTRVGVHRDGYPHQFSGGQRQRVMIAMALVCEPEIVIADEPTTALDVTVQAEILDLLDDLRSQRGMSMILITHDMGVIAQRADRVGVMYGGRVAESAPTADIFGKTRHRYTQALLSSIPTLSQDKGEELFSIPGSPPDLAKPEPGCPFAPRCDAATDRCREEQPPFVDSYACWHPVAGPVEGSRRGRFASKESGGTLLRVVDLVREHPAGRRTVKAVSGVSFEVAAGETFGLVGESGCGKSSLGRMLVGLDRPDSGEILFEGDRMVRPRKAVQMMFQDSGAALDPRMRVGRILREPLVIQGVGDRPERVRRLLDDVGLPDSVLDRYPYELSGGQRQRVGLARALALEPQVLIADEPVSALDVSIRSQILNLMRRIQIERGLSSVVISHDLAVVRYLADRVGVMYLGKLVETGTTDEVYGAAAHPYTAGLLAAVPDGERAGAGVRGEPPSAVDPPSGCRFRTRCALSTEKCGRIEPPLAPVTGTHLVACHYPLQGNGNG
ncbi:ABC transporter ATP-binding protein [Streptomyces sp. SID13666]|uniref:dipeptide ABC transporter ATP-binding protein n=1 Tax=unclassified Streptomyces TaxID=2593676 RepID=UPI0013C01473|nr:MULTISPECIES: ABC transporter ATP-binding protein [unclassified Streptomyces]NEA53268.1 ABC transporter ATP-binding protein [Streptomyces sp. SID13666]NEA69405.1 ABC transporter ATP-binding protein [Streptomyces sp. SID13588]